MPIIIIVIALVIYGAANIHNTNTTNQKPFTAEELEQMLGEMVGKSKKECRKILKNHKK